MNKFKTKIFACFLSVTMLAGVVSGCGTGNSGGGGSSDNAGGSSSPSDGQKTVLKVQWIGDFKQEDFTDPISGEARKGVHVLEEEFEKLNPSIDLQYVLMGWDDYQKKTQTMIMAGEADVYQAPGIGTLAEQGLLEPLQPFIDKDNFDLSVYIDGQVDGWKVVGSDDTEPTIYGLPLIGDTRYIAYDKQIFDDWGVPYISANPTPEELIEAAKKMTGTNPKTGKENFGIYHKGRDAGDTVMNLSEFYGGTWGTGARSSELKVNFDTPEMLKAFETLIEINKYAPSGVMLTQGGENFGKNDNNIAIDMRCNPAVLNNIIALGENDRYGLAYLFVNENEKMGGLFAGSPIVIAANSKAKDAAWEYIKFTSTDFFMNYFWENQRNEGLPTLKSVLELDDVKNNSNIALMFDSMKYLWTPRYVYRAGQARQILTTAIEDATLNNVNPKEALQKAQKEVDEWIQSQ